MAEMEPVEMRVDELLLRPWRLDDADAVHRACQDPVLQHWSSGLPAPFPFAAAVQFVTEAAPAALADGTALLLAIVDDDSGEVLGSTDLRALNTQDHTAELGYWSAPWARGHRVTERASRALLNWGFEKLGLARVDWRATVGNHASRITGLRLGFIMMGVLPRSARRRDGSLTDQWVGSLLPDDLTAAGVELADVVRRSAATFGADRPVLHAGPATLRAPTELDVAAIVDARNAPQAHSGSVSPHPYTRAHAESYVRQHAPDGWARGTKADFTIADGNDAYIGALSLQVLSTDPAVGQITLVTTPAVHGYATAGLRAAAKWGFNNLGLHRIQWWIEVGDDATRRIAEDAGFRVEGTLRALMPGRQTTSRHDCWMSALLPSDLR
jgi:RimJ/RimL family protein N-acetyltransferase